MGALSLKDGSFNQTAYRVLLLLKWLSQCPFNYEQINAKYKAHPQVQKEISQDTLRLYLNTLKTLGCSISRASKRTGFSYRMSYHPFNYVLTTQDIETLKQTLQEFDEHPDYWNVIYYNGWLQNIFRQAANTNRETLAETFFAESRLLNFENTEPLIYLLEIHCKKEQPLQVYYRSPLQGLEIIPFLPKRIFYQQGVLYLTGNSADQPESSMLRIDRIEKILPLNKKDIEATLFDRHQDKQLFVVRLLNSSLETYEPFCQEETVFRDPDYPEHIIVKLKSENEFLLKQQLLSYGSPFQILYPERFRKHMIDMLSDMRDLYV